MWMYGLIGFMLGMTVPALASRFGKILPADPGMILASLWHRPRFPKGVTAGRQQLLRRKWQKLALFSLIWGVFLSLAFGAACVLFSETLCVFACLFFYVVALLMAVDEQYFLLPDFFTIPLLLLGLTMAYFAPHESVSFGERLFGAWFGYLLSTVSVFLMSFVKKGEFGAGDVKMLTAFGAWFGVLALNITLLLSFVLFAIFAFARHRNADALGPALGLAGMIVFFLLYTDILTQFF